ncbi:gluconokinase [Nocardia sp. NEAU-351]|uniref:Gluconokinase n=2 Tax=Nocardia bovistercoris TaxID=2785916 RepID=A0A931I7W3_9NOCA|nr:gluconokinase [Nocardia bovistercoris]
MGVSGSGKSTVGALLAQALDVPFAEGDALHPAANIAKMSAGVALTDADRAPWLDRVATWLGQHLDGGVITCSALKRAYRDRLRVAAPSVLFAHPQTDRVELARRTAARRDHFMPPALLDSQLATLEPLATDEHGVTVDATAAPERIVEQLLAAMGFA